MHTYSIKSSWALGLAVSAAVLGSVFLLGQQAQADTDPPGCVSTGVNLSVTVFRADGTTPVGGGSVAVGETIKYQATLSHAGGVNCNYEGGDLDIITPDGANTDVDGGAIPLISSGSPFNSSVVTYVVSAADIGGDNDIDASAVYTGGTSHLGSNNVSPVGATAPAATTVSGNIIVDKVTVPAADATLFDFTTSYGSPFTLADASTPNNSGVLVPAGTYDVTEGAEAGWANTSISCVSSLGDPADTDGQNLDLDAGETITCTFTNTQVLSLVVEKTVRTAHQRSWNWSIDKSVDDASVLIQDGQSHDAIYTITVTPTEQAPVIDISGTIVVTNPVGNPSATVTSITDTLSVEGAAVVTCPGVVFPKVLAGGESINCTYQDAPTTATNQTNTATANTSGAVPGGSDVENVTFGAATLVDECIVVDDTYNFPGTPTADVVCFGDPANEKTWTYTVTFGPAGEGVEIPVSCGVTNHPNTASFLAQDDINDTGENNNDQVTVNVNVNCSTGCTLTQGYWKTHNDYHNGGKHANETWEELPGGLGEDTIFFSSGQTWYTVFKTAPKGNVYYNLAHQYMAAKLNILAGASAPANVLAAIASAEALFGANTPAEAALLKGGAKAAWTAAAGILGSFNEGSIGPGHCDEQNPT